MIELKNVTYRIGERILFQDADFSVIKGQKIGLVGPNGSGKTTLFRLIKNELETDKGDIVFNGKNLKITSVEQEITNTKSTILDFVLEKDTRRSDLLKKLEQEKNPVEIAEIHEKLNDINSASAPGKAASLLAGLGFSNDDMSKTLNEFSGGWQMRAALAAALFADGDLLLLDEPTNHLDLETSIWLENYLVKTSATILMISHDRDILNRVCNGIISIENGKILSYGGNYDAYEQTRAMRLDLLKKQSQKHEQRKKHLQSFVDRFRYKATKAKQAQSRLKMIEKMGDLPEIPKDYNVSFDFPSPPLLASPLLQFENVNAGYGDKVVLKNLSFRLDQDARIAFLGKNGNGKTTLAKIISGKLEPLSGEIKKSAKLNVAYFSQIQTEELDISKTAYDIMSRHMKNSSEVKVRAHLGRFGLTEDKANTRVEQLSGGEKSRLSLAIITKDSPNILILDEPTNHLDIASREALIDALNEYQGAIILITHDLHIIELACDRLWHIKNQTQQEFNGSIEDFKKELLSEDKPKRIEEKSGKQEYQEQVRIRQEKQNKERKAEKLLNEIEKLEIKKSELECKIAENYTDVLQKEYNTIIDKISELEEEFFLLQS